ncbi:MAG TPA: hypothetical protein VGR74_01320 [Actinomycetota bacterium]|jgi:hypothetical protein|nr:hypothetical protein [Actinomycetota bacterium]
MPSKTIARPGAAKRQAPPDWAKDGPWLPGLAEALEVYRRIARVGGVRPRPAGRARQL